MAELLICLHFALQRFIPLVQTQEKTFFDLHKFFIENVSPFC